MQDRKCPDCQEIMTTETYNNIEINTCASCKGVFLDFGEIKKLTDSVPRSDIFDSIEDLVINPEKVMSCSDCGKEMDRREYIYGSGNHIHFCKACGGIYLDGKNYQGIQNYEANRKKAPDIKKLYAKAEMEGLMASRQQNEILEDIEDSSAGGMTGAAYKVWKKFF